PARRGLWLGGTLPLPIPHVSHLKPEEPPTLPLLSNPHAKPQASRVPVCSCDRATICLLSAAVALPFFPSGDPFHEPKPLAGGAAGPPGRRPARPGRANDQGRRPAAPAHPPL